MPKNSFTLFVGAVLRFALVPLFFFVPLSSNENEPFVDSDLFTILLTLCFGGTNGYLASAAMTIGPQLLPNGPERDLGSTILLFFLTSGLFSGALTSLLSVKLAGA